MIDYDVELANANDGLEHVLNERKRLLDLAPKLFDMLFNFCKDCLSETDEFIVETYWEIVKRRIEALAIDLHHAKQEAENYSVEEEFEALRSDATDCLRENHNADIREKWEQLEG